MCVDKWCFGMCVGLHAHWPVLQVVLQGMYVCMCALEGAGVTRKGLGVLDPVCPTPRLNIHPHLVLNAVLQDKEVPSVAALRAAVFPFFVVQMCCIPLHFCGFRLLRRRRYC
jgi:hypothetical protein